MTFQDFHFKDYINLGLEDLGFTSPTEIQELIIPKVLNKQNIIGKSATGTGKTHAFILPLLQMLDDSLQEVQVVIISPTRELALQLNMEFSRFVKFNDDLDVRLYVGGTDRDDEIARLRKKQPQIVIGTIGKIKDLAIDTNVLKIHTAKTVVIDEADMVFAENDLIEIDQVFSRFQDNFQLLTFSATIPNSIIHFLNNYHKEFTVCDITNNKISKDTITHIFIPTKYKNKNELLLQLLQIFTPFLAIIFANTKTKVDEIANFLASNGIELVKLTGDLQSRERKQVLKRIKTGQVQYVVASDIAARGLDIEGVSHIINYELPQDIEYYIHRTGRTARYNYDGYAISFYDYEDDEYINKLEEKGLNCQYRILKDQELIPTKERNYQKKLSKVQEMEMQLHQKYPVPKKVKPGYKKKRKEMINKELRKLKRQRIEDIYRKRSRKN
ncbi:MAG TPA: DEAD/DEAH box helicase [Bacilli bacterium]